MYAIIKYLVAIIIIIALGVGSYIFWPIIYTPIPANGECLPVNDNSGKLVPLRLDSNNVYGIALTYPGIIYQTWSEYHPEVSPPVFRKLKNAI